MALPSIALPGTLLGPATKYLPGPGTHIHDAQIYASIAGPVTSSSAQPPPATTLTTPTSKPGAKAKPLPLLSIARPSPPNDPTSGLPNSTTSTTTILPEISSEVLARITRLGPRFASADILVIDSIVCSSTFQGLIRREDVRATEKDKVTIADSFRVGDLVRGVVISLGDQSNYYIETARNELGVVMATSEDGNVMFPVSWKEFADPRTGRREGRKVAKPF
jgi:exosome complex component CSL4